MTEREWREIPGLGGDYQASDDGQIRSLKSGSPRILRPALNGVGYLMVAPMMAGRNKSFTVHSLVARTFLGPRPDGHQVRHLDGCHTNNSVSNLAYGTPSENQRDTIRYGNNPYLARTHCPQGHPYSGDNVVRYGDRPHRECRICRRERGKLNQRARRKRIRQTAAC